MLDRQEARVPETLGHQDPDHVLLGVAIPGGAVAAVPALPSGGRHIIAPGGHGHAEAPAAVVPEAGEEEGHHLLFGGDVSVVISSTESLDRMRS